MSHKIKGYGWRPDLPDHRDHIMYGDVINVGILPSKVDLRPLCPPVRDQGQLGSCTGNATGGLVEYIYKQKGIDFVPSRLEIYYNARVIEGDPDQDNGAQIRDCMKSIVNQGVCPENEWAYDITKFADKPPQQCYDDGLLHKAMSYRRLTSNRTSLLRLSLSNGIPFAFGFSVYDSFESQDVANTGIVNIPAPSESLLGGHAVMAVGYDDSTRRFIVKNSWGTNWGQAGYFTIPYSYLTNSNLADDFWVIRVME